MKQTEVISLDSESFEILIDRLIGYIKKVHGLSDESKWISGEDCKRILGISSNTTLQQLRDQGKIRFSQPMHKVILYDKESVIAYIESHSKNTF